ncbi:hypothetical protein MED01_006098 [Micromonospora sp. MED01]|uniref:hypothetical protein n=1 Tax=Micromonospora alfalfae TaxID=2911212 RepID=UPI001EE92D20|nr:hypothetical protein [Micromonospora alfalfae]MCG5467048.1 hypothetical protein [Micromonospora alfalfae]
MILFVDGIDGSGKTALVRHLHETLGSADIDTYVAEPLWRHLTPITAPEQFGPWVTSSSGTEVAIALVRAMIGRINSLRRGGEKHTRVHLVDRGPKTVYASALAHAGGHHTELGDLRELLANAVRALQETQPCKAVELGAEDALGVALPRLAKIQAVSPQYLRYLRTFAEEMRTGSDWPGLPTQRVNSFASVDDSCRAVLAALHRDLNPAVPNRLDAHPFPASRWGPVPSMRK